MPSNKLRVIMVSVIVASATAAACSFPEVGFAPVDPEALDPDASRVAPSSADAQAVVPKDVDPQGKDQDAAVVPDGGGRVGGDAGTPAPDAATVVDSGPPPPPPVCNGAGGDACDCDKDGYKTPSCGGTDCDDYASFIRPTQTFVSSPWDALSSHAPAGDWNCDGTVTKQYRYNISCNSDCSEGFAGNPGCGQTGTYNICQSGLLGLGCSVRSTQARTQGCR